MKKQIKFLVIISSFALFSLLLNYKFNCGLATVKIAWKSELGSVPPCTTESKKSNNPRFDFDLELMKKRMSNPTIAKIHAQRVQHLRDYCARKKHQQKVITNISSLEKFSQMYGSYMSVLSPHQLFECRVAKSGTTPRSLVLWSAFHGGKYIHRYPYYHPIDDRDVLKFHQFRVEALRDFLDHYLGVIFVRDPIMKIISAYFNKFCDSTSKDRFKNLFNFEPNETPTLALVLKKLANEEKNLPVLNVDDHFTSYFEYCAPCLMNYSFIGRLETMTEDLNYLIFNKTSLFEALSYTVEESPRSPKFKDCPYPETNPKAYENISLDDVKLLIEKHKNIYEAFDYNPDDVLHFIRNKMKEADQF